MAFWCAIRGLLWAAVPWAASLDKVACISSPASEAPIPTFGKVFADYSFIEPVRPADSIRPALLLWNEGEQAIGPVIEYRGRRYEPCGVNDTVVRQLNLPAKVGTFGSVPDLLSEICRLFDQFVALPQRLTALLGRLILATHVLEAMPAAPRIVVQGCDRIRARQLFQLLHSLCRHALPMAAVTPSGLCSLPSNLQPTLLIDQTHFSTQLLNLLAAATTRSPVLRRGHLLDLFGAQAIFCGEGLAGEPWPGSLRIPCISDGKRVPMLDRAISMRITEEFQPRLLAFRFSNYRPACATVFDSSKFEIPLRDLSNGLAAATPGDRDLQEQLHGLLRQENEELVAAAWVNPDVAIVEALLAVCHEAKEFVYIGEIAEIASKILEGRGEKRVITSGEAGRRMKNCGFATERRDARGIKLRLTSESCARAHELAHRFGAPAVQACPCMACTSCT
jgi:hypothetical protein